MAKLKATNTKSLVGFFFLLFLLLGSTVKGQKVAVVLSGGGASAYAHIGFLRALEENQIPIDYITGTSMGAIIGGLYAAGFSPDEIQYLLSSEEFLKEVQGISSPRYNYLFKDEKQSASWVDLKFRGDGQIQKNLPTHLIDPLLLDFELMRLSSAANAIAHNNFDSLFIPFRCVASDIGNKKVVVFNSGNLSQAIRASSTYPFYIRPLQVNEQLLFAGGFYNNFTVKIAQSDFNPDIIIGSNVSYNYDYPSQDDLISQVKSMLVAPSDYSLNGTKGLIVSPKDDIGTFDFWRYPEAINSGYNATLERIEEIKALIPRHKADSVLAEQRAAFNAKKVSYKISEIVIDGANFKQAKYIQKAVLKNKKELNLEKIRADYLTLKTDPFIEFVYANAEMKQDSSYALNMSVNLEKPFTVSFGGNVSNKAINTGYLALQWKNLGNFGAILSANTYFGKYYSSANVAGKFFFEGKLPFSVESYLTFNRWDYFRNRTSFFQEIKPAFVIENEAFTGVKTEIPLSKKTATSLDFRYFSNRPSYYLTNNFTNVDTADISRFNGFRIAFSFDKNTLNEKQYATSGEKFEFGVSYVLGNESYDPGSTSSLEPIQNLSKAWLQVDLNWRKYFPVLPKVKFYPLVNSRFASFYTFSNVISTQIFQPQFNPFTESPTLFLPNYRSLNYVGFGLGGLYEFNDRLSIRTQHHLFQPLNELQASNDLRTDLGSLLADRFYLATLATVYQTPVGPIALNLNYYDRSEKPWSFMINFGYILFNDRSL